MRPLLTNRAFRRLWLIHALSLVGGVLLDVGLMVLVYQRSGSALQAMGVTLSVVLPQVLFGPVAGAVADHLPRPSVLRGVDLFRAALCLLAVAVVRAGGALWVIYALVVVFSAAQTLHEPARMALVPKLAPTGRLVTANGLITSTTQAAYALGHGAGALLVLRAGIAGSAGLAALAFAASAALAWRLREPAASWADALDGAAASAGQEPADGAAARASDVARDDGSGPRSASASDAAGGDGPGPRSARASDAARGGGTGSAGTEPPVSARQAAPPAATILARAAGAVTGTWQSAGDGLAVVRREPLVRALVTMEWLEWIPHGLWTPALMLAFTTRDLGASPAWWGAQESSFAFGMLVGAVAATAMSARLGAHAGRVIVGNAILFAVLTLLYAASPTVWVAAALCFAFGPTSAMRDVAQDALLQSAVADRYLGRVYATRTMGAGLSYAIAAPAFALAADHVPVRWVYAAGAALYLAAGVYAASRKSLRQARVATTVPASRGFT